MKIFFVGRYNNSDILTGPEKVAKKLFYSLQLLNDNIHFVTYFFKSCNNSSLYNRLFGFSEVSENYSVNRMGIVRLLFFVIKEKPDLIHFITFERFYIPLLLLMPILKSKIIYTVHGLLKVEKKNKTDPKNIFGSFKDSISENLLFKLADRIIFLSNPSVFKAKQFYSINDKKCVIIPNGVEDAPSKMINQFDFTNSLNICFYNGNTSESNRGLEQLISILEEINGINIYLNVIGKCEGSTNDKIKIDYFELMDENKLKLFFQNQHICVDSLTHTTQPLFALEAMAHGLIVITSTDSGISDIIQNGVNGFVYNSGLPEDINKIILDIFNKEYDLNLLSTNAVNINQKLNWNEIGKSYLNSYKDVLSKN